jgi:hypothetical protein
MSSRTDQAEAWDDAGSAGPPASDALYEGRRDPRWTNFRWLAPARLLDSVNDQISKGISDLVNARRMRWVNVLRQAHPAPPGEPYEWRLPRTDLKEFSFTILGDPGEQDRSQYAVVAPLMAKSEKSRFMVILSDVIYPAGDVNQYVDGFYRPYQAFPAPVYAVPGNHDWYDGLEGFMYHFCGAEPLASPAYRSGSYGFRERVAQRIWRRSSRPERELLHDWQTLRREVLQAEGEHERPRQPGPYWAMETTHVVFVAIDTGVTGDIDGEQGEWLLRVASTTDKPLVLLTGKPLYVDGELKEGRILWGPDAPCQDRKFKTIHEVVLAHRFVAVIGGDVHNYQYYRVGRKPLPGKPGLPEVVHHFVSGGGGAYLSATHRFGKVDIPATGATEAVTESEFLCYPLRGDSLALFTRNAGRVLAWAAYLGLVVLTGAAALIALSHDETIELRGMDIAWWRMLVAVVGLLGGAAGAVFAALKLPGKDDTAETIPDKRLRDRANRRRDVTRWAILIASGAAGVGVVDLVWDRGWSLWLGAMAAITAGVLLAVLAVVLISYYARSVPATFGSAVAVLGPVGVAMAIWGPDDAREWAAVAVVAVGVAWYLVPRLRQTYDQHAWFLSGLLIVEAVGGAGWLLWDSVVQPALVVVLAVLLIAAVASLVLGWAIFGVWVTRWFDFMDPDEADALFAEKHLPARERVGNQATVSGETRSLGRLLMSWPGKHLNKIVSEAVESDKPPFFKNFLTVEVNRDGLVVRCWGVSGFQNRETDPTLEHEMAVDF